MIKVNGRDKKWEENITVALLLEKCKYTFPLIMVKVNGKYIPREKYKATTIIDGDDIQVIHSIAGG
ncbi:MAG TPA: sulfur carrier protein ThiS [Candidatus Atribacteria bacterium]|nr:sulfur carrier protein ThiS [Candidatus Atribacteria bacterium]